MSAFFDTNVFVYAFTEGDRRERALTVLADGGVISTQVLNEFVNVARGKHRRQWPTVDGWLATIRARFPQVVPVTVDTHDKAVALARDHGLHIYDALIVAAALEAGCDTLFSEDMQDGRKFGALTIRNPFIEAV